MAQQSSKVALRLIRFTLHARPGRKCPKVIVLIGIDLAQRQLLATQPSIQRDTESLLKSPSAIPQALKCRWYVLLEHGGV